MVFFKEEMKFGQWAKKSALSVIAAIIYAVFAALVPFGEIAKLFGGSLSAVNLSGAICKAVCALPPLLFIFAVGFGGELRSGVSLKRLALCLPALVVAINNFPILPLINDDAGLKIYIGDILPYILYCISVGVLEEFVFRGIVLPLLICRLPKNKKGLFAAVMISSALFGGLHLMNLLGGFSLSVFLQVAYSFLIGALFGACMLFTGNLFVPVALH
ncbi:MAG: CPBP family intramembrane metalloprotease, partial [Clostridia bacterium]|nr:CPBP family intramembrane metalloprotease [Clostridia bacterium]